MTTSINSIITGSVDYVDKTEIAALEALQFTRSRILASSNFPNRDNALIGSILFKNNVSNVPIKEFSFDIGNLPKRIQNEYSEKADALHANLKILRNAKKKFYANQVKDDLFLRALYSAQFTKDIPIENCGGIARTTFYFLLKNHRLKRIEVCNLAGGDHSFVIIDSKLVLDGWTDKKSTFLVNEAPLYLEDYKGVDLYANPVLKKMDPQLQRIKNVVSNINSSDDFRAKINLLEDKAALNWFISNLDAFHALTDLDKQITLAKQIIATRPKMKNEDNLLAARCVISQLKFFLDGTYGEIYNLGPISTIPSVFENWKIKQDCLKDHVSSLTIDYMIKIGDLFSKNQRDKGFQKVFRMPEEIRNTLLAADKKIGKETYRRRNARIAQAAYRWIMDQMKKGLKNKRYEEVFKIFKKLPLDIRASINKDLFELIQSSGTTEISNSENLFCDLETNQMYDDFRLTALERGPSLPNTQRLFPILDVKVKKQHLVPPRQMNETHLSPQLLPEKIPTTPDIS